MLKASKLFNQLFQKANEFAIQKNWSQAKSTFQEILSHESAQEMSPEFRLKVTVHLADCHIHLGSFNEAREILENRTIVNFSEAIEDISTKVSYHLVYGHAISENWGLEASDKAFNEALRLAESSNDNNLIESVLESMLYVGRLLENWNYLLERANLASEIASEKQLSGLEIRASEARAKAYSELGYLDEAISIAKKLLAHSRESKNVDEYTEWSQFINGLNSKLTKNKPTNENQISAKIDKSITIEELPQAGDFSSQKESSHTEESAAVVDLPDAISDQNFIDTDLEANSTSSMLDDLDPSKSSITNKDFSNKRRILPANLIKIPPIFGLDDSKDFNDRFKAAAAYILECYYFEIYKKGTVTESEKKSLHNLFGVLKVNREEASKILRKVLLTVKDTDGGQADYDTFFKNIYAQMCTLLPKPTSNELIRRIASAINHENLKLTDLDS